MDGHGEEQQQEPGEEERQSLERLALEANQKLEEAGQNGASQAFNLGCTVTALPAAILVLLVFVLTRGNWVAAAVTLVLAMTAILGFANYAAYTARAKTMERTFQGTLSPEITRTLKTMDLPPARFDQAADAALPEDAVLRKFLNLPPAAAGLTPDEGGEEA